MWAAHFPSRCPPSTECRSDARVGRNTETFARNNSTPISGFPGGHTTPGAVFCTMRLRPVLVTALACIASASLPAQAPRDVASPPADAVASLAYRRDALGIAPVWNGLAVVRGAERARVANLNFFWPRRIDDAFQGDSARVYASRAIRTRRVAAVLTDAGAVLLAAAVVRRGPGDAVARGIAYAGAGAFALSVPLHFAADDWLARAVWWHNERVAR